MRAPTIQVGTRKVFIYPLHTIGIFKDSLYPIMWEELRDRGMTIEGDICPCAEAFHIDTLRDYFDDEWVSEHEVADTPVVLIQSLVNQLTKLDPDLEYLVVWF